MVASDNTRDPFYAYGDLDLIEVYREATRILHFDHSARSLAEDDRGDTGRSDAAAERPHGGRARRRAWCSTRARTINELVSRPQNDRVVLYGGKQIDRTLPDYRELD